MMTVCLSPNGPNIARLQAPPMRLLVATIGGVGIIERSSVDAPWQLAAVTLADRHVSSLAKEPGRGGVFAGAHNGGLFFSDDDGRRWERRTAGLTIDHVFSLGFVDDGGVTLYAGTEPVSLFRSRDDGKNWAELPAIHGVPGMDKWTFPPPPHTAHTKSLAFDRRDPNTIYACIEQGALLKTTDGGISWRELDSYYRVDDDWYRDIHRIVAMPSDPDELLMTSGMGLYRSLDAGERWEKLTGTEFRLGYPDHLVVSPADENVLYMSGATTDPSKWHHSHMADGTVMTSRDRGRTWKPADRGLPTSKRPNIEAMCIATWPGGFELFVGNTDGEVYCSADAAESWNRVASGLAPVSKVGHFRHLQAAAPAA
jgi:photosystem II stability/assembly factor-like uncharacterized protein